MRVTNTKIQTVLFFLFFFSSTGIQAQDANSISKEDGFLIMAGKAVTKSKSVYLGYNNNQKETTTPYFQKFPAKEYNKDTTIQLSNGLTIPRGDFRNRWMVLKTERELPEGNAIAVNDHQVAIAGGISLENDRNEQAEKYDPLVDTGVTAEIRYIALQRSRTARECVEKIGELYNKYGISHPHGFAIADSREIWYIEAGGGNHWAAVKVPEKACWIQGNSYRIDKLNPKNKDVLTSPGLFEFTRINNMWNPAKEVFSFKRIFGGADRNLQDSTYVNTRKLWRAISLLAPSLPIKPGQKYYPTIVKPEQKISIKNIINTLRDEFQDTEFYPYNEDNKEEAVYPISSPHTNFSSIIEIKGGFPADIGVVIWTAFSSPVVSPYVPVYFGVDKIPPEYAKKPDGNKAYKIFNGLAKTYYQNPSQHSDEFPDIYDQLQEKFFKERESIDSNAFRIYKSSYDMSRHLITVTVNSFVQEAIELAEQKRDQIKNQ
ncbi:MAG: C69 family dipeptidase [Bacteroidales bacterium]